MKTKTLSFVVCSLILQGCSVTFGAKINNLNNDFCKSDIRRAVVNILMDENEKKETVGLVSSKLENYLGLIKNKGNHVIVDVDSVKLKIQKKFYFSTENNSDGCELVYLGYEDNGFHYINTMTYINQQPIYSCECSNAQ